jgi:hypothetical protein
VTHYKLITACFMVLSIIAQSVTAVSAPCPKLASVSDKPITTVMDQSDAVSPCHAMLQTSLDSKTADTSDKQSCCGESSCPMHYSVTGALFIMPELVVMPDALISHSQGYRSQYLSAQIAHLYRPPILL